MFELSLFCICLLSSIIETYDVVVIVGALSVGQVPVSVVEELWQATKPGDIRSTTAYTDNINNTVCPIYPSVIIMIIFSYDMNISCIIRWWY